MSKKWIGIIVILVLCIGAISFVFIKQENKDYSNPKNIIKNPGAKQNATNEYDLNLVVSNDGVNAGKSSKEIKIKAGSTVNFNVVSSDQTDRVIAVENTEIIVNANANSVNTVSEMFIQPGQTYHIVCSKNCKDGASEVIINIF